MRVRGALAGGASLLALLAISAPAQAHGPQLVGAGGQPLGDPYQRWLHQSRMPVVEGTVTVQLTGCPWSREGSCVNYAEPERVYLESDAATAAREGWLGEYRLTLYHELGHSFDARLLNDADRATVSSLLGRAGAGWWEGAQPAAERFSEAYAICSRYRRAPRHVLMYDAEYGYRPTRTQHAGVCRLIQQVGQRARSARAG